MGLAVEAEHGRGFLQGLWPISEPICKGLPSLWSRKARAKFFYRFDWLDIFLVDRLAAIQRIDVRALASRSNCILLNDPDFSEMVCRIFSTV